MSHQEQLKLIIQSLSSQNDEMIQHAQHEYINLLSDIPEELLFIHFDLINPENEQDCIKMLVFLGSYFSILHSNDIKINENSYENIQNALFSLFQNESFNQHQYSIISNVIFKAARYFKGKWPQLPENLYQLINHPNPFISSSSIQCLTDCINKGYLDIRPFYDDLIVFIQTYLSDPNEYITITIISILKLFYTLVDFIDQEEQNEIFIPIINLIPNYLQIPHENSIMINDLFLFARYHQNLFCESFQNYFEVLANIIEDMNFPSSIRNSSIYCLFSIIPNYSKYLVTKSCLLFDFFCSNLLDEETYDAAIYAILLLSDMYGNNEQYSQHLYSFFKQNIPDPVSYISFSISYKRIKGNFINMNFLNELLNDFAQGFTSDESSIRFESFQSFWPLIEIFHESEDDFDYLELASLLLKIIPDETEIEVLNIEIKTLSKLLKFYSNQLQEILPTIIELLNFLISEQIAVFHVIQCFKYIALSSSSSSSLVEEEDFLLLSEYFYQILIENYQEESGSDLFFFCLKNLPCFKNCFTEDVFNSMMESLYQLLFDFFDENKKKKEEEENDDDDDEVDDDDECLLVGEKPSIMKFFLCCIENDAVFDSPEIVEQIKSIAFDVFEEKPSFEIISNEIDLDLTECCSIIPKQGENASYVISYKQMSMYRNSLILIIKIFTNYGELIEPNYESLYKLTNDFYESFLKTNLYSYIFQLERLITPFIQSIEEFTNFVDLTLAKEIVNEYDEDELECLSELVFEFIKFVVDKIEDDDDEEDGDDDDGEIEGIGTALIRKIVDFSLHVLACLEIENEEKKEEALLMSNNNSNDEDDDDDDCGDDESRFLKAKINFALIVRESFRYYQILSIELFNELTFNVVDEIQMNNDSNKVIASIIFSDFLRFYSDEGESYFAQFFELFTSYFSSQNLFVKLGSIYGLSVIASPVYYDVESLKNLIGIFIQDLQNEFNVDKCSMIVFALLQIFQNYSSEFDVSVYFQQFWDLLNGEAFQIPFYCNECLVQSLVFFGSEFGDQIPEEKVCDLEIVVQKLMSDDIDASLVEQLESFWMKLSSKKA